MPIDFPGLLALAPLELENQRSRRYSGDTLACDMGDFAAEDQRIIRHVYEFLTALFVELSVDPQKPGTIEPVKNILRSFQFYGLVDEIRLLGCASQRERTSEALAKTIHDLRGGAMTSLVGHLDATVDMNDAQPVPDSLFPLVRDHLKIMRNSIFDLDVERRKRDLLPRAHSVDLLVDKWAHASFHLHEKSIRVRLECHYPHGTIAECCVESASIDRILYNLMNNAALHTEGGVIDFWMIPVPSAEDAQALRFVVANPLSPEAAGRLRAKATPDGALDHLFTSGVSSTGSGLGLTIAAEFVANAFGLLDREEAVFTGHLGARLSEDEFVVWFHWPLSQWNSDPRTESMIIKADEIVSLDPPESAS